MSPYAFRHKLSHSNQTGRRTHQIYPTAKCERTNKGAAQVCPQSTAGTQAMYASFLLVASAQKQT
eukprot:3879883-Amphidinium_carterae.1